MNVTDILILLGLAAYMVLGFRDGFLKKVFAILGLWGGLVIATKYMVPVGEMFAGWFGSSDEISVVLAFACLFLAVTVVVNLFYRWFGRSDTESLKFVSRIAGAIFGAAQGAVAISLLLLMFNVFDVPSVDSQNESLLYKEWIQIAPTVFDATTTWIPDSKAFFDEVEVKLQKLKGAH
jgi:membrane protein required for colicin V production